MDARSDGSHPEVAGHGGQRLSDADRSDAVKRLARHRSAGRLTADEVDARTTRVRAARTQADLARIFADLPADHPVRTAWRDRHWRTHAAVFALMTTVTLVTWLVVRNPNPLPRDYGTDYWWPVWLALLWAAVVLLHLLRTAGLLHRRTPPAPPTRSDPAEAAPVPDSEAPPAATPDALAVLTPRELEVLALVGQGRANKDIAAALFISERTARTHVSNILHKLELTSRTQAAIVAVEAGLRPPGTADR